MSSTPIESAHNLHTPVTDYNNDTAMRLDVSPSGIENKHETMDTKGRPLVTFLKWRMTRKQRLLLIGGLAVIFLVVILLIAFLAIVPAVIQHYINSVDLSINYLDVKSISSPSTLDVELSVNVQHDIGFSTTTDDITAFFLYDGIVFGSVVIPGLDIRTGKQNYNMTVDRSLTLTNIDVFNVMVEGLLKDPEISLEAKATFKTHAIGLTIGGLDLERTLSLKGFNQFRDPTPKIEYINWIACSNDSYQMDINVTLTNPSSLGLNGIGALNLSLYYADSYLGYVESLKPNLGLPRGESEQLFRATVLQTSTALKSMARGVIGGSAQFYITGNNVYSTPYTQFQEAIRKVNMSVLYTDSFYKLGFNTSCNILPLLV